MSELLDVVAPIAFLTTSLVINRLMAKVQLRLAIDAIPRLVWSALLTAQLSSCQRWLEYRGLSLKEGLDWVGGSQFIQMTSQGF